MSADFNPNSNDAILAKLLANSESHGAKLDAIQSSHKELSGAVKELEREKHYVRGVTASIAILGAPAWEWVKGKMA